MSIKRQLTDIQVQAQRISTGKPNISEIEQFSIYNEEIKSYLKKRVKEKEILKYINEIPEVFQESERQQISKGLFSTILSYFTSGLVSYYREQQKIENAKARIQEIGGKYSSIEFLMKSLD